MPDRSSLPVLSNLLGQFTMSPSVAPYVPFGRPYVPFGRPCDHDSRAETHAQ
jgi:hypothetical protein